ncbi:MAG TPA: hypothetical protein VFM53_09140 [Anaeromyxobacteraceae bacterium]|nr:hypothetical protein [Anaeromyxobacteraceae bacterium]
MRLAGLVLAVLPLALGSAGCLRLLDPDYECVNECFVGETGCADDVTTRFCIIEPFFGCMVWVTDQDCGARAAYCSDGDCVCGWGYTPCGPDGICTELTQNPSNCGACGVVCADGGICVDAVCVPKS